MSTRTDWLVGFQRRIGVCGEIYDGIDHARRWTIELPERHVRSSGGLYL